MQYNPIDRYTVLLKDGETTATIYPIHNVAELPPGLLGFLCDEFNMEIDRGTSMPFFDPLDMDAFQRYWFSHFGAVMVLGDSPTLDTVGPETQDLRTQDLRTQDLGPEGLGPQDPDQGPDQGHQGHQGHHDHHDADADAARGGSAWEKQCLGYFNIKPQYPGRSGHICSATFVVNAGIRGKGIGRTLVDCYLQWAPKLGYTYSLFPLVFDTNVAARRILEGLNFKRVGRLKAAGILKGHDTPVDLIMYGKELVNTADPAVGAYRFDKIKFYLETGKYPAMADRQEKSRLRSSSSHYRLDNGRLMLKDKEVVSDPVRQMQICSEMHLSSHGGINKTTSMVAEKYHWSRIKDTVAAAIKGCAECRDQSRTSGGSDGTNAAPHVAVHRSVHAQDTKRRPKVLHSQPNNPNARHLIRARGGNHGMEEWPEGAGNGNRPDETLLAHELLDDNIMAAVEAAQRHLRAQPTYASVAAGDSHDTYRHYRDDGRKDFDDHGQEIEIARALIQANEDEKKDSNVFGDDREKDANVFLEE